MNKIIIDMDYFFKGSSNSYFTIKTNNYIELYSEYNELIAENVSNGYEMAAIILKLSKGEFK